MPRILSLINNFFFFNSGPRGLEDRRPKKKNPGGPRRRSKVEDGKKKSDKFPAAGFGFALPAPKIAIFKRNFK